VRVHVKHIMEKLGAHDRTHPTHLSSLHVAASSSIEARELPSAARTSGCRRQRFRRGYRTRCRWTGGAQPILTRIHEPASAAGVHRQGKHLLFSCVITVTKLNLVRPFGLRSSEAQIPQIVVNVRNWRKTMETSERMILLHTQDTP
jgi:hypothetical protein